MQSMVSNIWLTYCLTLGIFVACTAGAALSGPCRG